MTRRKLRLPGGMLLLALAVGLGLAAAYLTQSQISSAQTLGHVVEVTKDVDAYSRLDASELRVVELPVSAIPADAVRRVEDAQGRFLAVGLVQGSLVRKSQLIAQGGRVSVQLAREAPSSVAMVVPLKADQGAELPKPGDTIDLLGVQQTQGGVDAQSFPGVRVLSVETSQNQQGGDPGSARLVVEVNASDEATIAKFLAVGDLRIALRPLGGGDAH